MHRPWLTYLEERRVPAMFVVSTTADSGPGSLRAAVASAADSPGPDTITFDAALGHSVLIELTGGAIAITDAVSIVGPAGKATLKANGTDRVFGIDRPGSGGTPVHLENLILTGGRSIEPGGNVSIADELVTLFGCVIRDGQAPLGGGIYLAESTGSLTLIDCWVEVNKSTSGPGGGVLTFGALTVERSTFSSNSASNFGGGLALAGPDHVLRNVTISGNTAGGSGGGIAVINAGGPLALRNSTVTANAGTTGNGGGLARLSGNSAISVESTVLSGNTSSGKTDVFSLVAIAAKTSAVGPVAGAAIIDGGGNLPAQTALNLGPLLNHGGPTPTHLPSPNSPLVNAGSNSGGLTTDQRGEPRQAGLVDIGAVELQPPRVTAISVNGGSAQRSRVTSLKVTLDRPAQFAPVAAAFRLARQNDGSLVQLAYGPMSPTAVTLTFSGPSTDAGSLADGRYDLRIFADGVSGEAPLDGSGTGSGGVDYVMIGNPATNGLFRMFGDHDGNGKVNFADFLALRTTFGLKSGNPGYDPSFDADGNGAIDFADFLQFRSRFGQMI